MNASMHYCYGNREDDQDGDSVIKVHSQLVDACVLACWFAFMHFQVIVCLTGATCLIGWQSDWGFSDDCL